MNIEAHKKAIEESLNAIKTAVSGGVENWQRTIGFHCSVAAADMLEIYLHEQHLIDPGATIKHDLFSSRKNAEEKLDFDFPNKEKIIDIMAEIESKRNLLCYGKPKPREEIEKYIMLFNSLRNIFDKMGVAYE